MNNDTQLTDTDPRSAHSCFTKRKSKVLTSFLTCTTALFSVSSYGAMIEAFAVDEKGTVNSLVGTNYDNWTNPSSTLQGVFKSGSDEIADDLSVVGIVGSNVLNTMGINVANFDAPSNYTGGTLAISFYDLGGGTFIGGFAANLPTLALGAGASIRLSFPAGALTSFNIAIPETGVYVSLKHTTATFAGAGSVANLGFQRRGPINVGTSTDNLWNVTTGSTFNFGGAPLANTGIFLQTESVPEPTSAALLLGSGAMLLLRRRRASA